MEVIQNPIPLGARQIHKLQGYLLHRVHPTPSWGKLEEVVEQTLLIMEKIMQKVKNGSGGAQLTFTRGVCLGAR